MVKHIKYLLFLLPFIFITNVNAVNYRGNLTTDLVRYYGSNNSQVSVSNGATGAIIRPYRMAIYFNVNTYYEFGGNYYAIFTGRTYIDDVAQDTTTGSQFNTTIEPYILTDSATENPNSCFFSSTSNSFSPNGWSTISWVVTCKLQNTLHNGTYRNILYFTISNGRNGDYTNLVTTLDSDFYLVSDPFNNEGQSIINSITNQTSTITNNQNQNTQDIINNQDSNTQDVIDNQNANTQQEIDSQKVCKIIDLSYTEYEDKVLNDRGVIQDNTYYNITTMINISSSTVEKLENYSGSANLCFYDEDKLIISCQSNTNTPKGNVNLPTNAYYVRFSINNDTNKPRYKICTNGNQALNDSVNNLNDTLNDTSQPNTNQDIQDMDDMVASDTPISDLITMPLTLINAYINGINSSCSPVNLGNLYGTDLILPCIDIPSRIGNNLWSIIDIICCIFMCYEIAMLFITAFDGITSLRDDFEGLYQPKHSDFSYIGKHGGGN